MNRKELATEISDIMMRLNAASITAHKLSETQAYGFLSTAWSAAYDARAALEMPKVSF